MYLKIINFLFNIFFSIVQIFYPFIYNYKIIFIFLYFRILCEVKYLLTLSIYKSKQSQNKSRKIWFVANVIV